MKIIKPICFVDKLDCHMTTPNCKDCERNNHNVRATGGMPALESICKWIKSLIKN